MSTLRSSSMLHDLHNFVVHVHIVHHMLSILGWSGMGAHQ